MLDYLERVKAQLAADPSKVTRNQAQELLAYIAKMEAVLDENYDFSGEDWRVEIGIALDSREPQCKDCDDVPLDYKGCFCRDYEETK